jgi:hypothetical protein
MGVATAGPVPASDILGSVHYQAMSSQQMASVTGEAGKKKAWIRIRNVNNNNNTNTNTVCLAACAGGDINVASPVDLAGLVAAVGGLLGGLPLP